MSIMKYLNNFFLFILFGIIVSCGEEHSLREENYYIDNINKEWLIDDSINSNFTMIDNNGISQSFNLQWIYNEMSKSVSKNFGITTLISYREYISYSYTSTYNSGFSISMTAATDNEDIQNGDVLTANVGNTAFRYDFTYNQVTDVYLNAGAISSIYTSEGLQSDTEILSKVELIDTLTVNNFQYKDILHFKLNDFTDSIDNFDITEIYISKNIGLIKYKYYNDIECYRVK